MEVNDVEVATTNPRKFFKSDSNKNLIEELIQLGLDLKSPAQIKTSHLTDKVIVVTENYQITPEKLLN